VWASFSRRAFVDSFFAVRLVTLRSLLLFKALEGTPTHAGACGQTFLREVHGKPPGLETARHFALNVPRRFQFNRHHIVQFVPKFQL
jgi:hypothetical protein